MAEEKDWWLKAREQAGRAVGGILGGTAGFFGEVGKFAEAFTETELKDYNPLTSFPAFYKETKAVVQGKLPPQGEGSTGVGRVLQGTLGTTAPKGTTTDEGKYQASPFYEAAKRDLLNIGEGLGELLKVGGGFENERLAEARKAEIEAKRKGQRGLRDEQGFFSEAFAAGRAAYPVGEDIAGGLIASPMIALGGFMETPEGKQMAREQPVMYALNAMPVVGRLAKAAKGGLLSKVQVAELNSRIAKLGIQGVSDLEGLNKHLQTITDPVVKGQVVEQAAKATAEASKAAGKVFSPTAPVASVAKSVIGGAEQVVSKGPFVAAGYSLGGVPGALALGGLAASPMLLSFLKGGGAGKVGEKVAAKVRQKTAPVKRAVAERRAYETAEQAEIGEQLLTTEGETAVVGEKLAPVVEQATQSVVEIKPVITEQQLSSKYSQLGNELTRLDGEIARETDAVKKTELEAQKAKTKTEWDKSTTELNNFFKEQAYLREVEQAKQAGTPLPNRPAFMADPALISQVEQQVENVGKTFTEKPLSIDYNLPANKAILDNVSKALPDLTPDKAQKLTTSIIASQNSPLTWLSDDNLRQRVAEKLKTELGLGKFGKEADTILNRTLLDLSNEAYNNGNVRVLNVETRRLLQPFLDQKVLTPQEFITRTMGRDFYFGVEDLTKAQAGPTYQPVKPVLSRVLQDLQTGMRQELVGKPVKLPTEAEQGTLGQAGQPVLAMVKRIENDFNAGNVELPNVIDFDPQALIETLRSEATLTTNPAMRGNLQYKQFLTNYADRLETLKAPKVSMGERGVRVLPGLAELPLENQYDYTLRLANTLEEGSVSKGLSLLKRLSTSYNPITGLGNYLGNSMVRLLDTGSPLPVGQIINEAKDLFNKVRKKQGDLTLQDELVLRAVPARDVLSAAELGGEAGLFELEKKGKALGLGTSLTLARDLYNYGDVLFKVDKAKTLAGNLIADLPRIPEGKVGILPVGPELTLNVMRRGDTYTFINPETGNILTSGTIEAPAVKRLLGSSVKFNVDLLYPDVRELPTYFTKLQGRGGAGAKLASAITFSPFMSYVLKASDSPFKKGILSTLIEGNTSSPLFLPNAFESSTINLKSNAGKQFVSTAIAQAGRYALSRGQINAAAAKFNNLSPEEKDQLRMIYAFTPATQKPLVFSGLADLENGGQVATFLSPNFLNFWSYTDTSLRGLGWASNQAGKLFDRAMKEPEIKGDQAIDEFTRRILAGKDPTMADALKTGGVASGLLYPLFVKGVESEKLGKQDVGFRDFAKPFGLLGRAVVFGLEQADLLPPDGNFNRATRAGVYAKLMDVIVGTQMTKEQTSAKASSFLNKFYDEQYDSVIQPLLNKAASDPDKAIDYQLEADTLHNALKQVIQARKESFNNTMLKLGLPEFVKGDQLRFRKLKVPTSNVIEEEQERAPVEQVAPTIPEFQGEGQGVAPPIPEFENFNP